MISRPAWLAMVRSSEVAKASPIDWRLEARGRGAARASRASSRSRTFSAAIRWRSASAWAAAVSACYWAWAARPCRVS